MIVEAIKIHPQGSKPMLWASSKRFAERAGMWIPYHDALRQLNVSRTPHELGKLIKRLSKKEGEG